MSKALGKRKRGEAKTTGGEFSNANDLEAILHRHFESRFKPLETKPTWTSAESIEGEDDLDGYGDDDDKIGDSSEDQWDGISDDEDDTSMPPSASMSTEVEVVDHTTKTPTANSSMLKKELKAYLSSKPPSYSSATSTTQPSRKPTKAGGDGHEDSAEFLANDLALQRLIAESHILSAAGGNASHYLSTAAAASATHVRPFSDGRIRRKTTDMRIQALGAKDSVLSQAKMPMSMRKGIIKAVETKEEKRRREARENGIILEKKAPKKGIVKKRGEREVGLPSVGKMRGAELRISTREIKAIENEGRRPENGRRRLR